MTLVDTATGEIVQAMSADEARALTDRIKGHAEALWSLLTEAHDRQAWKALGYARWEDYVRGEFAMSKQHSYRVLDHGRVIRELEAVAESPIGDSINEHTARQIKPHLPQVVEQVRERVEEGEPPEEAVRAVVSETRQATGPRRGSRGSRDLRADQIAYYAEQGYRAAQIADEIGVGVEYVRKIATEENITLPDKHIGKTRAIDPNRIVGETVAALEGLVVGVELLGGEVDHLDPEQIDGWATSLSDSLRSLNRLGRQLKEMAR